MNWRNNTIEMAKSDSRKPVSLSTLVEEGGEIVGRIGLRNRAVVSLAGSLFEQGLEDDACYIVSNQRATELVAVVATASAMFDGSGGGIGDLKRAAKKFVEKKYRIYTMMADRRVTYGPTLFKTPDDAAKYAKENDFAADLGLHEYLAVQDETTEKIVKYL